jgi:hypothetical protein
MKMTGILPNCTCPGGHKDDFYNRIRFEFSHHG